MKGFFYGTIIFLIGIVILAIVITIYNDEKKSYFECIDMFGNNVICTSVYIDCGSFIGTTQDGSKVKIFQYKEIKNKK